eukprot:CAMPEP_0194028588 /NCGR_PEP_ID=MMETSP0009_2-20130614/2515_1 /TAXON_ID=210454 /ORGANISM="Grammatophora oceanica, Strain CCMP 410" /LENGTH=381 /DNA_ID=CAMNT_0038668023 /DNA_START=256 /DNA_END=1401 /DNA_ORIENTATION=-
MTKSTTQALHERLDEDDKKHRYQLSTWKRLTGAKPETQLPRWVVANPQDDTEGSSTSPIIAPKARTRSTIVFTARKRKSSIWSLVLFAIISIGMTIYWHLSVSHQTIVGQVEAMMKVRKLINVKLRSAEKDVKMLSREVASSVAIFEKQFQERRQAQDEGRDDFLVAFAEVQKARDDLDNLKKHILDHHEMSEALQDTVRDFSLQAGLAKYGPGSHKLRIDLIFPDKSEGSLIIETADLSLMPHSVFTFLEMADYGLWDGCSFVMNAMHVIKASPVPYDDSHFTSMERARTFSETGLNGPKFNEYNEKYPHEQYTLGFAGGNSPSWYINTQDNVDIHAGDPAFARVVEGQDVVEKLERQPTQNGIWFRQRIGIKEARVLRP